MASDIQSPGKESGTDTYSGGYTSGMTVTSMDFDDNLTLSSKS